MSAFDNYTKDEVVSAITDLARDEFFNGQSVPAVVESIMEAVTYGITRAMRQYGESFSTPADAGKERSEG
jgi:hypothetical protein